MPRLSEFLGLYKNTGTKQTYKHIIKAYLQTMYPNNQELKNLRVSIESLNTALDRYFESKRDHLADIQAFQSAIGERPPKTVRLYIACIRSLLIENDIELSQRFWRRVNGRIKGTRAQTHDHVPSHTEFRKILLHLPVHGKALALMLASSGMRIGEATQLELGDINLDATPLKINLRGSYTKTGNPRITFASDETKEAIREWLKVRGAYLKGKRLKIKNLDDSRLFPFTVNNAGKMWRYAIKKSRNGDRDKDTNRYRVHPHVLRKFFRTNLSQVIPVDIVEALMGHEGYLTQVYRKYPEKQLAEFYQQGVHVLNVFGIREDINKLKSELEQQNQTLQNHFQNLYENIVKKNTMLENQVVELNKRLAFIEKFQQKFWEGLRPEEIHEFQQWIINDELKEGRDFTTRS
jgi:integrase